MFTAATTVVATNDILTSCVGLGDFVALSGLGNAGCAYEVIAFTNATATESATNLFLGTCSSSCATYELFNGLASDLSINYLTCIGNSASVTVPGGSTVTVCMRADSVTGKDFGNLTTTFINCGCITPS